MSLENVKLALKDELDRLARLSGRPEGWIVDDENRDCLRRVSEWIHTGDFRRGFTLRGPVGTGKSRIVEAAGNIMRNAGLCRGIRRIEAVELVNMVTRAKGDRSVLEKFADHILYPFLWIEDLLTEGNAPSFVKDDPGINCVSELLQVRYKRWEQGLPLTTGFTTNGNNDQLFTRYEERTCSRMNHLSFVIPLPGPDRRAGQNLPTALQQRMEFTQPTVPIAPDQAIGSIIEQFKETHDMRRIEQAREQEKRKVEYIDDMRARVRRMNLAELHQVIQTDVYDEVRDLARNQFNVLSPVSYKEFLIELEAHNSSTDKTATA